MKKEKNHSFGAVGTGSLLTAFGVLCITVFALLSLSTVQAERRLSESAWQTVSGYYEADLEAERILASLRTGEVPAGVQQQGQCYVYQCAVSENQHLAVEVLCQEGIWEVVRWQLVYEEKTAEESAANVWQGNRQSGG